MSRSGRGAAPAAPRSSAPATGAPDLDEELFADELPVVDGQALHPPSLAPSAGAPAEWKVLVVDDDPHVRAVSELVLRHLRVDGRKIHIVCVEHAEAGRRYLREHEDVAVAIVDVVMESEMAGLDFMRWVREEHGDGEVRLIVRTGQPGTAPETEVMAGYDIHDYLEKSETTSRRLVTSVMGGIRAWRDLKTIERQREGLRAVLHAVDSLFEVTDLDELMQRVVAHTSSLLSEGGRDAALVGPSGLGRGPDTTARVLAALGPGAPAVGTPLLEWRQPDGSARPPPEPDADGAVVRGDGLLYVLDVAPNYRPFLVCEGDAMDPWARDLVELFGHAVTLALRNRMLWEKTISDMSVVLAEREVLLKEIHHRVKNNLQIVSGLLSIQASKDLSSEARSALIESGLRIRSISLVHQLLYGSRDYLHVDLVDAARGLAQQITASVGENVQIEVDIEEVRLTVDQAIPCCLILNEFVTNAVKHGRSSDGRCSVRVRARQEGDHVNLSVADRGPGIELDLASLRQKSFGLQIVDALTRQLRGKLALGAGPGARFELMFPVIG